SKEESLMQKIRKSIKFNFANHECDIEKQIFELISAECISLFEMPEISVYGILWLFPLARKIEWKSYQLSLSEITNLMGEKSFIAITDGRLEKPSDLRCFFPFRNLDVKKNEFIDLEWIKDYESFDRLCLYGNYVETLEPLSHLEISKLEISIKSEKNLDELFTFLKSSCWIDFSGPLFLYRKLEQYQRSKQNWYLAFLPEIETFPMYYNNYPSGEEMGHVLKAVFHLAVVSFCTEKHFEPKVFNLGKETGRYLYLCKKYEESLDVFRQLRYLIENTEDAEKHFLIKTEGWIGQILAKTGNYDDAIPLLRSVCGEKWKDDADNETLLMWYWRMVSMYRKNMNINVSEYGINDIIEVMFLWGKKLYENYEYEEAEEILRDCYQKRKEVLGEDDDNTLTVQEWLGYTLYREKKYEEAEGILKDCYQKRKEGFGEDYDGTLKVQAWLGYTLYQEKKYEEAEGILKDCYEKRKGFSGENHDYMLTVQEWLGRTLYQEKKYEEAEGTLKDCYEKRKESFGENHDDTLTVREWLERTLEALK
ncbi:MAG: tetratricopeptide repeat protein, partial [Schaedlerella sp.]|uniref:tetratricopeptide repeat protein n=1 Tax=Schaedlerella sp. TaxID=2676057 RepID=UPI003528E03A